MSASTENVSRNLFLLQAELKATASQSLDVWGVVKTVLFLLSNRNHVPCHSNQRRRTYGRGSEHHPFLPPQVRELPPLSHLILKSQSTIFNLYTPFISITFASRAANQLDTEAYYRCMLYLQVLWSSSPNVYVCIKEPPNSRNHRILQPCPTAASTSFII